MSESARGRKGESVMSMYGSFREYRLQSLSPGAAAERVAALYGRRSTAEVRGVVEAMATLEARDGAPSGAPLDSSQSTKGVKPT